MSREEVRKVRSDKKRDVKPFIPYQLYDCIHRLAFITELPVKDVAEQLCMIGVTKEPVVDNLSKHFRRDYQFSERLLFRGVHELIPYKPFPGMKKRRITTRFTQEFHDHVSVLAHALDLTTASTTAMLLDASIRHYDVITAMLDRHIVNYSYGRRLPEEKVRQLEAMMKFIKKNNPYDQPVSWYEVFKYFIEEIEQLVKK